MAQVFLPSGLHLNNFNAASPGGGTGVAFPQGQLGVIIEVNDTEASQMTDTSVTGYSSTIVLREGRYQLVKAGAALTAGMVCMWDTSANSGISAYQVVPTWTAAAIFPAGIALESVTSGNYTWIQVGGLSRVRAGATSTAAPTDNTAGDVGQIPSASTTASTDNTVDSILDSTDVSATALKTKQLIGRFYEAPGTATTAALKLCFLLPGAFMPNVQQIKR